MSAGSSGDWANSALLNAQALPITPRQDGHMGVALTVLPVNRRIAHWPSG